jgi:hypothetical protein
VLCRDVISHAPIIWRRHGRHLDCENTNMGLRNPEKLYRLMDGVLSCCCKETFYLTFLAQVILKHERQARACGGIGFISDCGLEGMGIEPHTGQKQSEAIFSVHLNSEDCSSGSDSYSSVSWDGYPRLPNHQGWCGC